MIFFHMVSGDANMKMPIRQEESRLLLVSNRVPVTIKTEGTGYKLDKSSGGLVTVLQDLMKTTPFEWIGWPGVEIPQQDQEQIAKTCQDQYRCKPVFIDDGTADEYYNGFSNGLLWPLFHYQPKDLAFDDAHWDSYQRANALFADVIAPDVKHGDVIWVHDYHLMLLPAMIRERVKTRDPKTSFKIGWFLHTPFPSSEILRVLPVRDEILRGVLASDLIGFHTFDYARHFVSSCKNILQLPTRSDVVQYQDRDVHVGCFPIGIDVEAFIKSQSSQRVKDHYELLQKQYSGVKVLVGVDRLDYTKGIPQKLKAMELFLTNHPEWIGKVVLLQIAVPSRESVGEYQDLYAHVSELVGRINGKFGKLGYVPVHYIHQSVSFQELVALYSFSHACLVSSTRDGMNMVSYEYVACQQHDRERARAHIVNDAPGVLVLSEFTGAASILEHSLLFNPYNTNQFAERIREALEMSEFERRDRQKLSFENITTYSANAWFNGFLDSLKHSLTMRSIGLTPDVDSVSRTLSQIRTKSKAFDSYDALQLQRLVVPDVVAEQAVIRGDANYVLEYFQIRKSIQEQSGR